MLVKKSLSLLIISIFAGGVLFYLTNYVLMPFDENGVLQLRNVTIISSVLGLFITAFIGAVHTLIDKLVVRKFYEKERAFPAVRRGLFTALAFIGYIYLKLFGFAIWYNVALVLAIFILIEYLFIILNKKPAIKPQKNSEEIEKEQ